MQFELWRAVAFVSSPIHLFALLYSASRQPGWYLGSLAIISQPMTSLPISTVSPIKDAHLRTRWSHWNVINCHTSSPGLLQKKQAASTCFPHGRKVGVMWGTVHGESLSLYSVHLGILLSVASIRRTGSLHLAAHEVKCSAMQLLPTWSVATWISTLTCCLDAIPFIQCINY